MNYFFNSSEELSSFCLEHTSEYISSVNKMEYLLGVQITLLVSIFLIFIILNLYFKKRFGVSLLAIIGNSLKKIRINTEDDDEVVE